MVSNMDIVMNNLVEHWDKIKNMNNDAKATFVSCLSPSHYKRLVDARPEVELIRKRGK